MRWATLNELISSIAHTELPLGPRELPSMRSQTLGDLGDAARSPQVRTKPRKAVIDDVRVCVVESRQDGCAREVDHLRLRASQPHHVAVPDRGDTCARDRQVAMSLEARAPKGADEASREDQIGPG